MVFACGSFTPTFIFLVSDFREFISTWLFVDLVLTSSCCFCRSVWLFGSSEFTPLGFHWWMSLPTSPLLLGSQFFLYMLFLSIYVPLPIHNSDVLTATKEVRLIVTARQRTRTPPVRQPPAMSTYSFFVYFTV